MRYWLPQQTVVALLQDVEVVAVTWKFVKIVVGLILIIVKFLNLVVIGKIFYNLKLMQGNHNNIVEKHINSYKLFLKT